MPGRDAFNRNGFDEQVPNRVYAYNNRISGDRSIGSVQFTLIKVSDARLGGTEEITAGGGSLAVYSSRARALVDAVYDWSRFNGLPRAYQWIRRELEAERVIPADLADMALRYGGVGTVRRIGVLLEREGCAPRCLSRLEKSLSPSTSTIPWIPTLPKRGTINRRWGVVVNGEA